MGDSFTLFSLVKSMLVTFASEISFKLLLSFSGSFQSDVLSLDDTLLCKAFTVSSTVWLPKR